MCMGVCVCVCARVSVHAVGKGGIYGQGRARSPKIHGNGGKAKRRIKRGRDGQDTVAKGRIA